MPMSFDREGRVHYFLIYQVGGKEEQKERIEKGRSTGECHDLVMFSPCRKFRRSEFIETNGPSPAENPVSVEGNQLTAPSVIQGGSSNLPSFPSSFHYTSCTF